jgi:hypothetical protein
MSTVFIALQTNEETRPIIEAILHRQPARGCRSSSRRWSRSTRPPGWSSAAKPTLSGNVSEDDDDVHPVLE